MVEAALIFKQINHGSKAWLEAVSLREKVLRIPLGSRFSTKELAEESEHLQIVAEQNSTICACAVLVPEGSQMKMQRVAVDENLRNRNIGSQLMQFCEGIARDKAYEMIYCHARDSAVRFYRKNNYREEGDYFDEDGIPHVKMIKSLN